VRAKHRLRIPWAHCCEARPRALVLRGRRATTRAREQGIGSGFATRTCPEPSTGQGDVGTQRRRNRTHLLGRRQRRGPQTRQLYTAGTSEPGAVQCAVPAFAVIRHALDRRRPVRLLTWKRGARALTQVTDVKRIASNNAGALRQARVRTPFNSSFVSLPRTCSAAKLGGGCWQSLLAVDCRGKACLRKCMHLCGRAIACPHPQL
jgi:hypothetical protein